MFRVQVEALLAKYEWIATDRRYFGQPNTAYDFGANDPKEVARRLTKLQEQKVGCSHACSFLVVARRDVISWGVAFIPPYSSCIYDVVLSTSRDVLQPQLVHVVVLS